MEFELSDLRAFKTVAEKGGITRAAEALHCVQSAVTTRIKHLEGGLDTMLFSRAHRRMTLTPEGQGFLGYTNRILKLAEEAAAAARGPAPYGALRIGSLESTAATRLPKLLARYHLLYPEVDIQLTTGTTRGLFEAIEASRIDCAFIAEPSASHSLEWIRLFEEELVIATDRGVTMMQTPADLASRSLIAFPTGCAYRSCAERWLATFHSRPKHVIEIASYHAMLACVAAGSGFAMVPRAIVRQWPHPEAIRIFRLPPPYSRSSTALIKRTDANSRALQALWSLVAKRIKAAASNSPATGQS